MSASPFQVVLSPQDIAQAQQLVTQLYSPSTRPEVQQSINRELLDVQRRPEAWGLVVPFLESPDPNVQFFGALTVQVKIARDWDAFPQEHATTLRDTLLELAGRATSRNLPRLTTRKLFAALCSLALRLAPTSPPATESRWPNWVLGTAQSLSASGATPEQVLEFLTIVAEEMARSDLVSAKKVQMDQILRDAAPAVVQAASSSLGTTGGAALKCLEAWIGWGIPADNITPLIPLLVDLLSPSADEDTFAAASDVLQEILTKSALSEGGAGLRTLTIPLLDWISQVGVGIMEQAVSAGDSGPISHSVCKLVTALGEHSTQHIAGNLTEPRIQAFIKVALGYTGFPGWYGADEEESEMVLPFWYLLEEALLDAEYVGDPQGELWGMAKMIYLELVKVLKRKVTWPADTTGWAKDQREKFANYRRDVGDALINAYYVLRDDMLRALVEPLVPQLAAERIDWEAQSALHNIKAVQEALPVDPNPALATLFGPRVLGRLPRTGAHRVRRTALATVGAYATWFTTGARTRAGTPAPDDRTSTPTSSSGPTLAVPNANANGSGGGEGAGLLLDAVGYVVAALEEPGVCTDAARALKELCDANRTRLAPHIQSFGELHQRLPRIPANEKGKVLQSIASVIQALPPGEAIDPILGVVTPVVTSLGQLLNDTNTPADTARDATIAHLSALTACSKGLTRSNDIFAFALEDPDTPEGRALLTAIEQARADARMVALREEIVRLVGSVMARWCVDAEVSTAVSELIKSITALPSDATLLSLSPEPLLSLVCTAARVQLTAVWLSLAALLVVQLDPPMWPRLARQGEPEVLRRTGVVAGATAGLVGAGLGMLGSGAAMEANPDVAQDFFGYLTKVGTHFPRVILEMQGEMSDGLFRITATALTLQERYSLVNACNFMTMFLRKTRNENALADAGDALLRRQGAILMEALLLGIGGSAPRSTVPNLAELLASLVSRAPAEARNWMNSLLMVDNPGNARIPAAAREKFMKAVLGTRSTKKTKEAANEYALVARGLEGSAFGPEPTVGDPLTSLREYTVASQLADSRAGSPEPELNIEETYEDPVSLGIIPEDAVIGLFYSFHTCLNPVLALLDPALHTPHYVRRRSKVLYTAILAAACKFFNPGSHKPVHDLAQRLVGRALADGICTIEYIQALSIVSYWREPDDGSCWRKVGLGIRMAYELNLHLISEEPVRVEDEVAARERLNQERTWFHLICYDWNTALQRGKPRMISEDHFPRDARQWLDGHSSYVSTLPRRLKIQTTWTDADLLLVASIELAPHYNLYQSLRSATTDHNRSHLAPFIRHTIREGERLLHIWAPENVDPTIAHISRAFIQFYNLRMRLITFELRLLVSTPIPGTSHVVLLDCAHAALALLRHVIAEFAPSGYLSYGQDFVPFSTAYAGAWLFKQYSRLDETMRATTVETFRLLSETCRAQTRFERDTTSYYCRFFDHLVKYLAPTNGAMVGGMFLGSAGGGMGGTAFVPGEAVQMNMGMMPLSLPPLEDMDATWLLAASGFDNWWQAQDANLGSEPFGALLS